MERDLVPFGFIQGLPVFQILGDAEDFSYEMGCGGITEEVDYMGRKMFQSCKYGLKMDDKMSRQSFAADDEKRMLYSPLMIPNILIPRLDEMTGEKYFVKFTPQTIEKIANKFMIEQRQRETNYEHSDKKFSDMVLVETWIVKGERDKAYELGFTKEQVPVGSWMGGYKFLETPEGDTLWNDYVKTGRVRGLSVEGSFIMNFSRVKNEDYLLDTINKIIKQIDDYDR